MTAEAARIQTAIKRVRVYSGGHLMADTTAPLLVWENPYYPTYYLPAADVIAEVTPTGERAMSNRFGAAQQVSMTVDGHSVTVAGLLYDVQADVEAMRDHLRIEWNAMDSWFEEDEEVFTHPRDPYTRVDILPSSRRVVVLVDGTVVADSVRARFLYETNLPTRYYLPKTDVRMDLLIPSDTVPLCPYKGSAEYWSIQGADREHRDWAWSYRFPLPESQKIAGPVAFWKADITVDGPAVAS